MSIKECSLVSDRNTHPGRDLRESGGPTRKFPGKGSRLLPQDSCGIHASTLSEGVSNVSKCGQGDHSWLFFGQSHWKSRNKRTSFCLKHVQTSSQVRLLLASGNLVTSILSSIWTVKQVRSLPEVLQCEPLIVGFL